MFEWTSDCYCSSCNQLFHLTVCGFGVKLVHVDGVRFDTKLSRICKWGFGKVVGILNLSICCWQCSHKCWTIIRTVWKVLPCFFKISLPDTSVYRLSLVCVGCFNINLTHCYQWKIMSFHIFTVDNLGNLCRALQPLTPQRLSTFLNMSWLKDWKISHFSFVLNIILTRSCPGWFQSPIVTQVRPDTSHFRFYYSHSQGGKSWVNCSTQFPIRGIFLFYGYVLSSSKLLLIPKRAQQWRS